MTSMFRVLFGELSAFHCSAWGVRFGAESIDVYLRFQMDNEQ